MATGWHGIDMLVPLGRLLTERSVAVADLVLEEREVALLSCGRPARVHGVRSPNGSSSIFKMVRLPFQPETCRIVIADLTPNVNLDLKYPQVQIEGASVQRIWAIGCLKRNLPQMGLESPATPRRIWNRELLTLRRCELEHRNSLESREMQTKRQAHQEPALLPGIDFQAGSALLSRLPAESLPAAGAVRLDQIRRVEKVCEVPRLIGPRVKLQFDLHPLGHAGGLLG